MSDAKTSEEKPAAGGGRTWFIIRRAALGLLLAVVILLIGFRLSLPGMIRSQVELQGQKYLGVPVRVGNVSLSLFGGSADLKDVIVEAPPGFEQRETIRIGRLALDMGMRSLFSDTIIFEQINLRRTEANLEIAADGRRSLQVIMEHLQRKLEEEKEPGAVEDEAPAPAEEGVPQKPSRERPKKGLRINEMNVTDVAVHFWDGYSTVEGLHAGGLFGALMIRDLYVPPQGRAEDPSMLRAQLIQLALFAPERFEADSFLQSEFLEVEFDLGAMLAAPEDQQVIVLPLIKNRGTSYVAESFLEEHSGAPMPENLHEFLVVVQNAVGTDEPVTFAELTEKAQEGRARERLTRRERRAEDRETKEEESPVADASVEAAITAAEEVVEVIAGATEQQPEEIAGKEPTDSPVHVAIEHLEILNLDAAQVAHHDESQNYEVRDVEIELNDFVFPHEKGTTSRLTASAKPLHEESRFSMTLLGDLANYENPTDIKIDATLEDQRLRNVGDLQEGVLNSVLDLHVTNQRLQGTMSVQVRDIRMKAGSLTGLVANLSAKTLETIYPEPIEFKVDRPLGDDGSWGDILTTFQKAMEENLRKMLDDIIKNVSQISPADIGTEIDKVGEGVLDATREVEETGRQIEGAVRGIFGQDSKEEEEE